jgi:hypothetical protein
MESSVTIESHLHGATIYATGWLTCVAAASIEAAVYGATPTVRVVRLDLRAVDYIDPDAFVRVVRALTRWRGAFGRRVTVQFPERSHRPRAARLHLVDERIEAAQTTVMPMTVSAAMSWPMRTSPG